MHSERASLGDAAAGFGTVRSGKMRYELWKNEDEFGVGWTFVPVDSQYSAFLVYKEKFQPESKLVWSIESETPSEAISRHHEFMKWGPRLLNSPASQGGHGYHNGSICSP